MHTGITKWLARTVGKYETDEVRVIETFWHWTLKEWEDEFEVSPKWLALQVVKLQKWGDSVIARPERTDPPYLRRRVELSYSQLVELFTPVLDAKAAHRSQAAIEIINVSQGKQENKIGRDRLCIQYTLLCLCRL